MTGAGNYPGFCFFNIFTHYRYQANLLRKEVKDKRLKTNVQRRSYMYYKEKLKGEHHEKNYKWSTTPD